jgi:hypothetical protein
VYHTTRARVFACLLAAAAILALPTLAVADVDPAGPLCLGLDCGSPVSRDYVPEAHGAAPAVAGLDELKVQRESGFYEIPAPVWQGAVQPHRVVYLSKPGQIERMPASVRNLRVVSDFELILGAGLNAATLVVIDHGVMRVIPGGPAAAGRRRKAQAAHTEPWRGCSDRYFCLYGTPGWGGGIDPWCGPCYYGTGWINFSPDFGSSMVNHRDGDSLIADGYDGSGARYCARQQSEDSTFEGNAIGNDRANSVALLGSNIDRC